MGGKTNTNSLTPTGFSTLMIPQNVLQHYDESYSKAQQAAATPFQKYSTNANDFVAGLNDTQKSAISGFSNMADYQSPYTTQGAGMMADSANANAAEMTGKYMSPYINQVVNSTMDILKQQQGQEKNQQSAEIARNNAWGGTRSGLQRALLAQQQGMTTAKTSADLYNQAYNNALGAAQTDLARKMTGGQNISGLGQNQFANKMSAYQAMLAGGTLGQQTEKAGKKALYNQYLQERAYPFQTSQFLTNAATGTGPLYGSSQYNMSQAQFTPFFSDPRLKKGVSRAHHRSGGYEGGIDPAAFPEIIGKTFDGQNIYRYSLMGGSPQLGLMADEAGERNPDAVGASDGYMTLDYARATDDAADIGHEIGAERFDPRHARLDDYARGGYADGGLMPINLDAIVASQGRSLAGLPGGDVKGGVYGGSGKGLMGASYVPEGKIQTAQLLKPDAPPPPRPSQGGNGLSEIGGMLKQGAGVLGKLTSKDNPFTKDNSSISDKFNFAASLFARGGLAGFADGGTPDYFPDETLAGSKAPDVAKPTPAGGGGSGGSSGGDSIGGVLGGLGSAASGIAKLAPVLSASDPRLKTGVRGYAAGGQPESKVPDAPDEDSPDYFPDETLKGVKPPDVAKPTPPSGGGGGSGGGSGVGGALSGLGSLASGLAGLFALSDPRLKEGVRPGYFVGGENSNGSDQVSGGGGLYSDVMNRYMKALARGESGGEKDPYKSIGAQSRRGDRPYGRYQIMGENIPSWAKEAGYGDMTPEQFLSDPDAQEKIARHQFSKYLEKTGSPQEAAAMWLGGPGYKAHPGARDALGTDVPTYVSRFNRALGSGDGSAMAYDKKADATPAPGTGLAAIADSMSGRGTATADRSDGDSPINTKAAILSALSALGGMASSNSPYLGAAIMQGIGAGAKTYGELENMYADIEQKRANTLQTGAQTQKIGQETETEKQETGLRRANTLGKIQEIYGKSIIDIDGTFKVILSDGSMMDFNEWGKLPVEKRPKLWGQTPAADAAPPLAGQPGVATKPTEATKPTDTAPKPADPAHPSGAPKGSTLFPPPNEAATQPPSGVNYGPASKKLAEQEISDYAATPRQRKSMLDKSSSETFERVKNEAQAASSARTFHQKVAKLIAEGANQTGLNAPGFGASTRANIVNLLNTTWQGLGLSQGDSSPFGASDSREAMLNKLRAMLGNEASKGSGQHAYAALEAMINTIPDINTPPPAAAANAAMNMIANQRAIDKFSHAQIHGTNSRNQYNRWETAFEKDNGPQKYDPERAAISKMILDPGSEKDKRPNGAMVLNKILSGNVSPKFIEDYFRKFHGLTGMSRYFTTVQ